VVSSPPSKKDSASESDKPPVEGLTVEPGAPPELGTEKDRPTKASTGEEPAGIGPEPVAPELLPVWEEDAVRANLIAQGAALHGLVAIDKGSTEWVYTTADLDAIAPPLTRLLNRYPVLAQLSRLGDYPALLVGFGGYAKRSLDERAVATAERASGDLGPTADVPFQAGGPAPA
jgi:hypothetical protein